MIPDGLKETKLLYIETAPFIYFTEQRAGYFEKMVAVGAKKSEKPLHM